MRAQLVFSNFTLAYDRHPSVHHFSGEVAKGAKVAITGPNGGGKSSLLKGIVGELLPMEGAMTYGDKLSGKIAYLPQHHAIDTSFPISIYEFVASGLWQVYGAFGSLDESAHERILKALAATGLAAQALRPIGEISGGQLQRARFARLILEDAPLILLDEPFTALDEETVRDLAALIEIWHQEGRTLLCVLHDLAHIRAHYPTTLLLARECIAFGATEEVLTEAHLEEARLALKTNAETEVCHAHT